MKSHRFELRMDVLLELLCFLGFCWACCSYIGVKKAFCHFMSVYTVSSFLFDFFTQVSHLQEECFVDEKERSKLSFAKRQVTSSMDFAPDSSVWGHLSGGLNTQAIHHCFPSVSAMHLRALYPTFRQVCLKHNVALKEATSLSAFVWGFVKFSN